MQQHAAHECDDHEHHGDEPGHVHDAHECDDHDHHVDDACVTRVRLMVSP